MMGEYLRIIKGEPYEKNSLIELNLDEKDYILGRVYGSTFPDIDFSAAEVTRKHAIISKRDGCCYIKNLSSTNGVGIRGIPKCKSIEHDSEVILSDKDVICLTRDVMFQYFDCFDPGMTFSIIGSCRENQCRFEGEISDTVSLLPLPVKMTYKTLINEKRNEVLCKGEWVYLTANYWRLVKLLCQTPGETVTHEEIISVIWNNSDKITEQDVIQLVSRTREKFEDKISGTSGKDIILQREGGYAFNDRL